MLRRDFLKITALMSAAGALPLWSRSALAQDRPMLPVPDLLSADGRGEIALRMQTGTSQWRGHAVPSWGYNGNLLGPALLLERGKQTTISLHNQLPEATTLHWHGLQIPGEVDGGPHGLLAPGEKRSISMTVDQPAATCWFHPHTHGRTGYQVAQGLAGLVVVQDNEAEKLLLPKQWGVDDLPLVFQDKQLSADGTKIDYQLGVMQAAVGWFGNMMLTNGVEYPQQAVPRGWLRLRLLNGCNARSLRITASDGRPLYVIASDGGLFAEPVKVNTLSLLPGERFEVLVDTKDGRPFDLQSLPVRQMGMTLEPFDQPLPLLRIQPLLVQASGTLPDKLVSLPAVPASEGLTSRWLQLSMDPQLDQQGMQQLMEHYGMKAMAGMSMDEHHGMDEHAQAAAAYDFHQGNKINGQAFDMDKPMFDVKRGTLEKWTISGEGDEMLHPFHIHGTQFRILSENGKPPAAHRRGWKDTVHVEGWRSEVLVRFDHLAAASHAYMAHCHLLEHEDTGMMLGFTVS